MLLIQKSKAENESVNIDTSEQLGDIFMKGLGRVTL